jgi:hypothetical protein
MTEDVNSEFFPAPATTPADEISEISQTPDSTNTFFFTN